MPAGARFGLLVTASTEFQQVPRLLSEHLGLGHTGVLGFSIRLLLIVALGIPVYLLWRRADKA